MLNDEIVKFSNMSCFFRLVILVILYITVKIKYTDAHSSVRDFSCKSVASQSRGKLKTAIKGLRIIQASVFNTGVGCRHRWRSLLSHFSKKIFDFKKILHSLSLGYNVTI